MEFRGIYENGMIRPSGPVSLPEGTEVEFHAVNERNGSAPRSNGTTGERPLETWKARSVDELATEQGVGPVRSIRELSMDWPDDPADSVDEFLKQLREWRK